MTDRDAFRPEALLPVGAVLVRDDPEADEGRVYWTAAGRTVATGWVERDGTITALDTALRGDGWRVELHFGDPLHAEPIAGGRVHGTAIQWASDGRVLCRSPFTRGTGCDLWLDDDGGLAESHPMLDGQPHGVERWWDGRWPRVHHERQWHRGLVHGVERRWTDRKLDPAYPKFWVDHEEVNRAEYDEACRTRKELPPWRAEDDAPERPWPEGYARPSR